MNWDVKLKSFFSLAATKIIMLLGFYFLNSLSNFRPRPKDSGTIETGKIADLILVEGNPLENISNLPFVYESFVNKCCWHVSCSFDSYPFSCMKIVLGFLTNRAKQQRIHLIRMYAF